MELKTLKDFSDKECLCYIPPFILGESMPKKRMIPEELLKAEAIKWVKSFIQMPFVPNAHPLILKKPTIEDWMNFFNLTEEDLR